MKVTNQTQIKKQSTNFGSIKFHNPLGQNVTKFAKEIDEFLMHTNNAALEKNHKSLIKGKPLLEIESIDGFGASIKANVQKGFKGLTELKTALIAEKDGFIVGSIDNYAYKYQKENGNAQKVLNNIDLAI